MKAASPPPPKTSTATTAALAFALGLLLLPSSCGYFDLYDPSGGPTGSQSSHPEAAEYWEAHLGGPGDDAGLSVRQTSDGGFVVAGYQEQEPLGDGDFDAWLLKLDADGSEAWSVTFGGSEDDRFACVRQTPDGGYLLAGSTNSFGAGGYDLWLLKTDPSGGEEWSHTFGGSEEDRGACVELTSDGGYVVTGATWSFGTADVSLWLLKTNASGVEQWSRTYENSFQGLGRCVIEQPGGGYVIAGETATKDTLEDGYLVGTDAAGVEQWRRVFGSGLPDRLRSVAPSSDGGQVAAGETRSFGVDDFDAWLIKTDADGAEEWAMRYGEDTRWDRATCVRQAADGGYILGGVSRSYTPTDAAWLIKTDDEGNEEWSAAFGGYGTDGAAAVEPDADGGYLLTGYTDSFGDGDCDLYLVYYKR